METLGSLDQSFRDPERPHRAAIILTHNRPAELEQCVESIYAQVDEILIIDNASNPSATVEWDDEKRWTVYIDDQPPNLSRLWNIGMRIIEDGLEDGITKWDIALLCDDSIVPPGWFDKVSYHMRDLGCVAGCSDPTGTLEYPRMKVARDSDLHGRMTGWGFILAGESQLRADEQFRWWWGDTDLDWRAREAGGMVMVPGYPVINQYPNGWLPDQIDQVAKDSVAFVAKWGSLPW